MARSRAQGDSRTRPRLPPGFGTIWVTVAVDLIGFGVVLPILPLYAKEFGASEATAAALIAAFSAAQFVCSPLLGRLSDRIGRKPVLLFSLAGTAVASLITGLAGSVAILFVGRIVDGVSGASVSVAQAAVADVASPEERPHLLGLLGAAFGLGFVAGPAIGALAALSDRRLPFYIAAAIAGVNAVVAVFRLPETHRPGQSSGSEGPIAGTEPVENTASVHGHVPVSAEVSAFRIPGVGRLVLASFLSLVAFSGFESTFALFANDRLDLHLSSTGAVFAVVGLVIVVVQGGMVRPTVRSLGERPVLLGGMAVMAVGLLLLALVHSWLLLVPALLALTVGQGLSSPTLSSELAGKVTADRRGGVLGLQQAAGGLARVIGPIAAGFALEHLGAGVPYVVGAVLVAGAVFALLLSPP
jgi:DHA1 family tetracycline resistance protein-like MFS transporter